VTDTATRDELRDIKRRLTATEIQAARVPVRLGKVVTPNSGHVAVAQIAGAVAVGDSTFTVDNVTILQTGGTITGTLTVNNQQIGYAGIADYPNAFVDNEWLLIERNADNGEWYLSPGPEKVLSTGDLDTGDGLASEFQTGAHVNSVVNGTGRYLFDGAKNVLDATRKIVLASSSADSFIGVANQSAPTTMAHFDFTPSGYIFPLGAHNATEDVEDPFGILPDVEADEYVYIRLMNGNGGGFGNAGNWNFVAISSTKSAEAGGGGGFPWPGPGSGPDTGTATVTICKALVDDATDVTSSDATFSFDGATAIIGTAPGGGTGTCDNPGHAFVNNEPIYIISKNGGGWAAIKFVTNIIKALVNEATGVASTDGTFAFDGATAIVGGVPAGSAGTAKNTLTSAYVNNEVIELQQCDDGEWAPTSDGAVNVISALVDGTVDKGDSSFSFDGTTALLGYAPTSGTATNTFSLSWRDNEPLILVQRNNKGWLPVKVKMQNAVLGLTTASVSGGTFSIDNIELVSGIDPRTDVTSSAETLSITNPFGFNADNNGHAYAVQKDDGTWVAIQMECPA
jgi:hypothetical protein